MAMLALFIITDLMFDSAWIIGVVGRNSYVVLLESRIWKQI